MYAEWFKWQVRGGAGQGTSSIETPISMEASCGVGKEKEGLAMSGDEGKKY